MKTVASLNLLHDLEARVETSLHVTIHTLQNLPSDILLQPAATGGWSIAQCLEHLNSYGEFYLPQIHRALDKHTSIASENFRSGWFGAYFIQMMLPESGKKYKALKKHIPASDLNAAAVVATFIHQQEALLSYIRAAKHHDLNKIKIPISISPFIKLKLGDVFQFIIAHNERHMEQAKRNL